MFLMSTQDQLCPSLKLLPISAAPSYHSTMRDPRSTKTTINNRMKTPPSAKITNTSGVHRTIVN